MAKIYLHGFISAFSQFTDAIPTLSDLFDQIQNGFRNLADENITPGGLSAVSMADGIGLVASGQYTGDGTIDRVVSLTFTPRHVLILSHTDSVEFTGLGSGVIAYAAYHRTQVGNLIGDGAGNADWQGIVTNGFKLGHSGTGLSNKAGQTYSYVAIR